MTFTKISILTLAILFIHLLNLNADSTAPEIIAKVVEQLEKSDEIANSYDFFQESQQKEFREDGKVKKVEKKTFRSIQLENDRYLELIKVDDKELNADQRKEEEKRRENFIKEKKEKKKPSDEEDEDFTWKEIMEKYEFSQLPSEGDAAYVVAFKPRSDKLKARNRFEKILNHLEGKAWISSDYNLIRASAYLRESVKYGLGILANIQELQMEYAQTQVDGVWLPERVSANFKARLLVKTISQEVQARYYNMTKRTADSLQLTE